ncbi:hypothetical protein IEN85_13620 [Pelagicoccus sp. NFK12]|uniref:Uncharacterized protein n=1 Tax=Pelagicoccus enzymogenes TaxID=2773457 RepID=A0A927F8Z4_9BACT|nr:DUF5995 family protein [Pelagicoccus enzymogenes]MBD5780534.1 hypothetical protein [Pelagicoccus enzymogenes]
MIRTIDEVITELDDIVKASVEQQSPLGYFAALYKRVTVSVRDGIRHGEFEDNERMEKLDIIFASRYLDAYRSFHSGQNASQSWLAAFSSSSKRLITLQHLLLGMNAHISLDLGIAAAETEPQKPLSLKTDFHSINRVLESLINDTQARLTRIFRPLGIADRLLGPIDENLSIFSIAYARDKAWTQTLELCLSSDAHREDMISRRDLAVAAFSRCIANPKKLSVRLILLAIRILERGDVSTRIKILDTQ